MRIVLVIAAGLALAALAAGCGGSGPTSARRTHGVVAAFYPLAFAAEQIGGRPRHGRRT